MIAPALLVGLALTGFAAPANAADAQSDASTTNASTSTPAGTDSTPTSAPTSTPDPTATPTASATSTPTPTPSATSAPSPTPSSTPPAVSPMDATTGTPQGRSATDTMTTMGMGTSSNGSDSKAPATLTIVKQVQDSSGKTLPDEAGGWAFSAASAAFPKGSVSGTTSSAGLLDFTVPMGKKATTRTVTVTETTQKEGYSIYRQNGWANATCTDSSGRPVSANNNHNDGFILDIGAGQHVTCLVINEFCNETPAPTPPTWAVSKSTDKAAGATVLPGDTITYTLSVKQTGGTSPSSLTVTDDLSQIVNNATLVAGSFVPSTAVVSVTGTTLSWTITNFNAPATLSYTVKVNAGAYNVHLVNVLTPPPGGVCVTTCTTNNPTPHWTLTKTSDPATGSTVQPGKTINYTLTAVNDSAGVVTGASATDDLSDVLDNAVLGTLPAGLVYNAVAKTLTWSFGTLAPNATTSVSFPVTVNADAAGATLHNVVTPSLGGFCPAYSQGLPDDSMLPRCDTVNTVPKIDLAIVKTHAPILGNAVDSGEGSTLGYSLAVSNVGTDAATGVTVTDPLPAGLTVVPGTISAPAGWTVTVTDGELTATYAGAFAAGATATIRYTALVGTLSRSGIDVPFPDIDNTACVSSDGHDADMSNNCSTDTTKVKSVAITASAICLADAPVFRYSLTPYNLTTAPTVALIWWTADGYAHRDPSIAASDKTALLANGAQQVNYVPVPAGWVNGQTISGSQLWPGAAVDAQGHPIAWPGWKQLSTGQWVLDPSSPFYDLRSAAVVEVRINPTTAATMSYPPAAPNCTTTPPRYSTAGFTDPGTSSLARTGSDDSGGFLLGGALLVVGIMATLWMRRRREDGQVE